MAIKSKDPISSQTTSGLERNSHFAAVARTPLRAIQIAMIIGILRLRRNFGEVPAPLRMTNFGDICS
jgi:hypothetical protein